LTISGNEEYEVEEILKHRRCGQGYRYLIKWKKYPLSEQMWELQKHLTNVKELLDRYNVKHNIIIWMLLILLKGHWDYLIKDTR
jgi:hypothetical protein